MLTPRDIRAARREASDWREVLNYCEEIYNHSFALRGLSFETAMIVMASYNFSIPVKVDEDGDNDEIGDTNS